MSWLIEKEISQQELADTFRKLIKKEKILKIPGTYDAMGARIAKNVGFSALYLSGAAYTASRALPDLGIINSTEIAQRARDIVRATNLPLLVDIDTGYGGVLNVARTVKEMTEAKVAAVQIEDQEMPKKCGHLNGKRIISTEEMVQKIKIIKEVSPSLVVIARTDAKSVIGFDAMIERAKKYIKAGADGIFPEALESIEEFEKTGKALNVPLLANMTEFGKTPYYTAEEFEKCGFKMVIYPVTALRVAAKAYEKVFTEIKNMGTQIKSLENMQTRTELYDTIRYYEYEKLDKKIAKTVLLQ